MNEKGEPVEGGCLFHVRVVIFVCPNMAFEDACKRRRSDPRFRAVLDDAARRLLAMDEEQENRFRPFNPPGSVNQFRRFGPLVGPTLG